VKWNWQNGTRFRIAQVMANLLHIPQEMPTVTPPVGYLVSWKEGREGGREGDLGEMTLVNLSCSCCAAYGT